MEPEEIKRKAEAFKTGGVSKEKASEWFKNRGVQQSVWIGFYDGAAQGTAAQEAEKKKEQETSSASTGATTSTASQSGTGSSASADSGAKYNWSPATQASTRRGSFLNAQQRADYSTQTASDGFTSVSGYRKGTIEYEKEHQEYIEFKRQEFGEEPTEPQTSYYTDEYIAANQRYEAKVAHDKEYELGRDKGFGSTGSRQVQASREGEAMVAMEYLTKTEELVRAAYQEGLTSGQNSEQLPPNHQPLVVEWGPASFNTMHETGHAEAKVETLEEKRARTQRELVDEARNLGYKDGYKAAHPDDTENSSEWGDFLYEIPDGRTQDEAITFLLQDLYNDTNDYIQYGLEYTDPDKKLFTVTTDIAGRPQLTVDQFVLQDVIAASKNLIAENNNALEQELAYVKTLNEVEEVFYDMGTGVMGISSGFEGLYYGITGDDVALEEVQYERAMQGFRTQASYINDGLTQEDIELGISGNIARGEYNKARIIFNTQLAQTTPQIVAQASVTYLSGGAATSVFGASTATASTIARVSGAAFMGGTVMGGTLADQYGFVSDTQRWAEAVSAASIETLSEAIFAGDMKDVLPGAGQAARRYSKQEVRDILFNKGVFSQEMLRMGSYFAGRAGKNFLKNGAEEGVEELIANTATELAFAYIEGRPADINFAELADGFIVGFGAGSGMSMINGVRRPELAKALLASAGVLSTNYMNLQAAQAKAREEVVNARDEAEKAKAEAKVRQLDAMQAQTVQEENEQLTNMTEEQATQATALYHRIRNAATALKGTNLTEQQRQAYILDGKKANAELKALKAETSPAVQQAQVEREAIANFQFGTTGTVEVDETTDAQGSTFVSNLIKVAKALGGTKVMLHKDYDAAAAASGQEKSELMGASGFFKAEDGSVHIVLPAMQRNTGFHEAYHVLARNIDPKYMDNFLKAVIPALSSLDEKTQKKYYQYFKLYGKDKSKAGRRKLAEEVFAEINADITDGTITMENAGAAFSHNIAGALNSALGRLGIKLNKYQKFTDLANFMAKSAASMQTGTEVERFSDRYYGLPNESRDFMTQIIGSRASLTVEESNNLTTAMTMLQGGKTVEEVQKITGWYQQDGQWKTEIPYGKLTPNAETALSELPGYATTDGQENIESIPLSAVLDAPALYKAYPVLKKLPVIKMYGSAGGYLAEDVRGDGNRSIQLIAINADVVQSKTDFLPVLVHEVQHAIQSIEGFAAGGSIGYAVGKVNPRSAQLVNDSRLAIWGDMVRGQLLESVANMEKNHSQIYANEDAIVSEALDSDGKLKSAFKYLYKSYELADEAKIISDFREALVPAKTNREHLENLYTIGKFLTGIKNSEGTTVTFAMESVADAWVDVTFNDYGVLSRTQDSPAPMVTDVVSRMVSIVVEQSAATSGKLVSPSTAEFFKQTGHNGKTNILGIELDAPLNESSIGYAMSNAIFELTKKLTSSKLQSERDLYVRLAGEVEARNAQRRVADEKLQDKAPMETEDVPADQQIAAFPANDGMFDVDYETIMEVILGSAGRPGGSPIIDAKSFQVDDVDYYNNPHDVSDVYATGEFIGDNLEFSPRQTNEVLDNILPAFLSVANNNSFGASIALSNDTDLEPAYGYMVSDGKNEVTIPLSDAAKMTEAEATAFLTPIIEKMLSDNFEGTTGAPYIGLWLDGGEIYVDRSEQQASRVHALELAVKRGEKGIYDVANAQTIKADPMSAQAEGIMFQINPDALPEPERITVKSGKYGSSVMRNGIPTMTFQEVVKDFRAKNGRDPIVAFWMGDQSGYGTYTLTDGSTTELEGGLGHLINNGNMKAGIVWASNKSDSGIQGVLQNADIVAEVSGHPVKSSRFYKGTTEIMAREFAIAWSNSAGKTIKHGKYEIIVPKMSSKNPLDAIKAYMTLVIEAYKADGKAAPANFENILTQGVKQGNTQYINLSDVETLEDLKNNERRTSLISTVLGSFENSKANQVALAQLGMPTEEQITDKLRDGYLVENDFQEGDIYAYYAPKRAKNGKVITQPGNHSTYGTDIMGELVAVAGARQNLFDMVPAYHHLRELKMTGHERVRRAQQNKFADQNGNPIVNEDIDVAALPNKEVAKLIGRIASVAEKRFKAGEITRADYDFYYSGKSGLVSTDVAADMQKMRVLNSQATIVPANAVLATMEAGLTWEEKVEAINQSIKAYKDAGYVAADIKTLLDEFYGEKRSEIGDYNKAGYPSYGHAQSADGLMFQSALLISISEMMAGGMTAGQIKAKLIQDGFSAKDATLLVAKAKGYKIGMNQGRREGRKSANEIHAERIKAQRKNERESTKRFREEAKGRLMNMNQINDELVNLIVELIEKYGNVKVTAAQVKAILRGISATQKKIYKKGMADNGKFALTVVALVDRVADIIEKQYTAQQLAEQNDLIRKVRAKQKALKAKLAKLPKTSRSPLISYTEEVNQMVGLEAGHLSLSSLKALDSALDAMNETTKLVNATVRNGQVRIQNPYVLINGKQVDFRRAKVYFNELLAPLEIEANQYEQALIAADIQNYMDATGADFAAASAAIMLERAEKEMTRYERALKQIADDLGLDINNVQDLEMALEAMAEEKNEENEARRRAIIDEVVVPTAVIWRNWMAADPNFADIFGLGDGVASNLDGLSSDELSAHIEARMNRLSIGQLRRVEFAMFDYIVNGKAYGTAALAAEVTAKNEGRDEMSELDMEAQDTRTKKGGALRNWIFSNLETTPTFFRRIFLNQSESMVARYMNTLGFSNLRSNVAKADIRHAQVMDNINKMLKGYGLNTAYGETALQIYSMVMQKPDKMSDAEWALALRKQFEMAIKKDNRYNKKVMNQKKKAVQDFFFGPTGALELSQIQAKLETVENLVSAWSFIGNTFQVREHLLANYAETFLGQRFVSEQNYIPFSFRRGGEVETLSNQIDNAKTVRTMLDSYSASKMGKRASSTFERNPDAIKTSGRYIDLNFFGTIDRTHKENEVKIATSSDVAYISEMTSENNPEFLRTIPSENVRSDVRQKIYDFLIDPRKTMGDEALSPAAKKWINQGRSMTVLYYFGAVLDQIAKQSAPMWNTLVEAKSLDSKLEFLTSLAGQFSAEVFGFISGDMDHKQRLASNFDIAERNVRDAVIQFTGDRPATGDKTRFEKGVDLSTKSLVITDKTVAGASWFAYYKDWHYQNGMKPSEWSWEEAANNPNQQAAEYASLMVSKDQNISTSRDASKFSRATGGVAVGLIKQFMIPFIDFLMNKKMNMMIDVQKMGVSGLRGNALRSAAGTILEIAHFQTMTWMVLAPLYSALGSAVASALGGEDDEEESWFSKKFSWDMWKRGMYTDLNPYVMPFKIMEDGWIDIINIANYQFSDERENLEKQFGGDREKAYELWEKTDGIPSFGGSRSDADFLFKVLDYGGPMGSIASQYLTAIENISTLEEEVPYYVTSSGTKKYLTTDEAERLRAAEIFKLSYLTFGFSTGLMIKEVNAAAKSYERDVTKRATSNENSGLDREVAERLIKSLDGQDLSMELFWTTLVEEAKTHPQGAKTYAGERSRGIQKYFAEDVVKNQGEMGERFRKHIATIRDIDRRFSGDIEVSFALHRVMSQLSESQQKDFALSAYLYYGIHGKTTIQKALEQQLLVYGIEGSLLGAGN
jgi:hypothetical protein